MGVFSRPALLQETLALFTSELLAHHIEVRTRYPPTPAILGDAQQLKQVFLNLLLNSLQALDGTGGTLTLATTPTPAGTVQITLTDTGAGIPPAILTRLGEPFFSTKPTGTGLGLAVVQSILTAHGGSLAITSQVGRGTMVTVSLPGAAGSPI